MQRTKLAKLHYLISRLAIKVKKSRQNDTGVRTDRLEIPEIDSHVCGQTTEVRRDAMEAPLVILLYKKHQNFRIILVIVLTNVILGQIL